MKIVKRTSLKGLSQIHRAPYDFRTRRLAVEFSRPCGTLPNFISTAFMVTYPTEPGRCPVDI